eukprot:gnl/Spiro4/22397_TR11036_c0_g1_i1.p1 gnl/Spiro4/22397_TR11036_c0_g1~~gnl/Spiro4/22397_TR11036_c0_g1_i1.p1  ORF type:complete len:342 (+),score=64.54 gnl/Spiro4/22397_TR11036_c0_g1_i1:59-1027(+)
MDRLASLRGEAGASSSGTSGSRAESGRALSDVSQISQYSDSAKSFALEKARASGSVGSKSALGSGSARPPSERLNSQSPPNKAYLNEQFDDHVPRRPAHKRQTSPRQRQLWLHNSVKLAEDQVPHSGLSQRSWNNPFRSGTAKWHAAEQNRAKNLRDDAVAAAFGWSKLSPSQINENMMNLTVHELRQKLTALTEENVRVRLRIQHAVDERDTFHLEVKKLREKKAKGPATIGQTQEHPQTKALREELARLRAKHDKYEQLVNTLEADTKENALLRSEIDRLARENVELKEHMAELKLKLVERQNKLTQLKSMEKLLPIHLQ